MNSRAGERPLPPSPPLVTLGVTCYNAASTINRAIRSAWAQTWPNKEIVVVDDASTDDSWAKIDELRRNCSEMRVIRHRSNKGYAGALNSIVSEAKGDFVAIFDDDDESMPNRVETQWRRIVSYEEAQDCDLILCYSNRKVVKPGPQLDHVARAIGRNAPEPHGSIVADYIFGIRRDYDFTWGMFGSCTLMARRETFSVVGSFDELFRRCAEWDFAIRAAFMGAHFIATDLPLITQNKTAGPDKAGDAALKYALQIRKKYKGHLARRRVYWSSLAMARCNYHGGKGRIWRSRGYLVLACCASPVFLVQKIAARWQYRSNKGKDVRWPLRLAKRYLHFISIA